MFNRSPLCSEFQNHEWCDQRPDIIVSGFRIEGEQIRGVAHALITGSYNYIRDGIALTLNRMVEYLEAHGVRVLVIAPTAKTPAFAHKGRLFPVPSVPLPARPEYRLALGLSGRARQELEAFRPDIMHIAVPDLLGYRALRSGSEENCRSWRRITRAMKTT